MMNIKRMPSCIAVVVAALLLAVSCGNMLEAPKAEGVEVGTGRLSVSMGDGRAVFPEELEFGTDKELTFTLSGSLDGGEAKEIRSWSAEGDKTAYQVMVADTSLTVEAGQWRFTLQAKRGGTVVATASKDLEVKGGTTNRLSFGTMAYSNEGTGTVTVTISWNEVEQVTSVVAGLYHRDSGELVSGTKVTFDTVEGAQVTYKQNVPAGTYRLKAQMKQEETVIGTYSELVRVAGGLSSEAERELGSLNTLYTVTLDFGGQGELRTTFPETYNRSQTVTLPTAEQVDSTTGAEFLHWYEEGDTEKKEVTEISGLDGDKTYCAYWQVASVTFTPDGGALDYEDTVTLSSQEGATIHYTVNDGAEKTGASPVTVSVTGYTTIIARATKDGFKDSAETKATYTLKRYTVTFNAKGGSGVAPQVVESGQKVNKPDDPTNGDKVLDGWYTSKDEGTTLADTAYDFDTPVEGDITLYAAWNGVGDDGTIMLRNKVMSKTSEVPVLSTKVTFANLYKVGVSSNVFISGRGGEIQPFVMGQYEVTQQLYSAVMGSNPSNFTSDVATGETQELRPVEQVSWYDAVVFCNKLSQLMELEPVYSKGGQTDTSGWGEVPTSSNDDWNAITCDFAKSGYRLPTEAEWEFAARGGNAGADAWKYTYAGTNEKSTLKNYAWYSGHSSNKTHQVGTKAANSLNLYDMSGNVWEWCWDWHDSIDAGTPSGGAASGSGRVCRGGGWYYNDLFCRVYERGSVNPGSRYNYLGFRLVRSAN